MAAQGPWEKYAQPVSSGQPWAKYAADTDTGTITQPVSSGDYLSSSIESLRQGARDIGRYIGSYFAPAEKRPVMPSDADLEKALSKPAVPLAGEPDESRLPMKQRVAMAKERVRQAQKRYDDYQDFLKSRSYLRRGSDASVYALSLPLRAMTHGEYGFGDVAGLVTPWGEQYRGQEQDFATANPGIVNALRHIGSVAPGVPLLRSMGAAEGGVSAAARATPGWAASITRKAPATATEPAPVQNAMLPRPAALVGPEARLQSIQDFRAANVPVFAPSLASKGVARVARTAEEMPLIGGTVKIPKNEVEAAAAAEQARITRNLGAAVSKDEAGLTAQSGLMRYRTAGLQDLERQRLEDLGVSPNRPAPKKASDAANISRIGRLNTGAMNEAELKLASQARVQFPQNLRARTEDLSRQEVQRIIDAPARDTSFAVKQAALYRRADDAMPQIMRKDASRNPNLFAQRESGAVARGLLEHEKSASISAGILKGRFGPLVARLTNSRSNMTIENMRAARTEIGRALAEGNQLDTSLSRTQLKMLYGALTNDIERALVGVAARARLEENAGKLPKGTADQADRALHLTRVADRYTRAGMERMDRFMNVVGAQTIEQAGQRIVQYLRDNTQNVRALETIASALRPEEWRAILGHVIDNFGRLSPGAVEAERIFSFERFATDFNKISSSPRVQALFERGIGKQNFEALKRLSRIAERMKYYETTRNFSGTAYTGAGIAGATALFRPTTLLAVIGGFMALGGAGKLLTSQTFASWLAGVYKAEIAGKNALGASWQATRAAVTKTQLGRLREAIKNEPDPQTRDLMRALANSLVRGASARDESMQRRSQPIGQMNALAGR